MQDGLEARLLPHPDGEGHETVRALPQRRARKKSAPCSPARANAFAKSCVKSTRAAPPSGPDLEKLGRRIGRSQGSYPAAAKLIAVEVDVMQRAPPSR